MPAAPLPANEAARLKALHDLDVMDSPPEAEFDALVNVASLVCGAPYSLITLVDVNRQWFKASKGMHGVSETPRSISFCAHAILGDDVLEVPDATRDPRFSDNPLVTTVPHARFYAGAPVVLSDGSHVGTLCVIDRQPRELNASQREILKSLAVAVARALEGRKAIRTQEKIMRALHKSEMLLDRTGAIAGVGGWEVDLVTGGIYWSKETRRIHGVPPDYVPVMKEAINFYAPEARPMIQAAVEEGMASGKSWDLELPFIRLDGTPIWVRAVGMVEFENDQPVRLLGAFQDITARRHVESESLRNAQLLRGSIEALDDAFALFDPQDRLVLCNQRYREIYPQAAYMMQPGNTFEDIIRAGALAGQYPEATGNVEAWVAKRMAIHRQPSSNLIQRVSDGRVLRIGERKLPDGHIVGFRVDITDLMRATEAAQEASNAKGQFLANMSHEIRTPMNAILGMLTLLRKTPLTPQQADYASKSEGATRLLLGVINDILDFSKIEAGKLVLNNQPFRTNQLFQDLQVILATSAGTKPVTVRYDIDPRLPRRLVGDALRLQQVLINLGGNAIKFTAQGEVVISITVASRSPPPAQTMTLDIAVKDAGIGIAPENQARIFDGFSQAEASITRRFGGTGLGVAISQRLVTLMGGKLQVNSALGQGSRFYFTLTLPFEEDVMGDDPSTALPSPLPSPMGSFPNTPRLGGMRLLLVEDNLNNQQVASELLQLEGAWVQIAADGQQAIDTIAAHHTGQGALTRFDLVLMDLQMPVMDGFTATHHIRNTLGLKNLPIVAMTANAMDSDRDASLAAGMDGHVGKPFDLNHLVGVLQRLAAQSWVRPVLQVDGTPSQAQAEWVEHAYPVPAESQSGRAEPFPVRAELVEALSRAAQVAGVDLDTALNRLGYNLALYERTFRMFVADLLAMPAQLRALQAARDTPQAVRLLHTLKGLAATLGVGALATIAGKGEALLQSHLSSIRITQDPAITIDTNSPDLPAVVEHTCVAIAQASPSLMALQVALQTNMASAAPTTDPNAHSPDTSPLDTTALSLALTALADKLRNFDMDAVRLMAALKHQFGAAIQAQTSYSLKPLEEAIDALDFELAKERCQTLHTLTKDT